MRVIHFTQTPAIPNSYPHACCTKQLITAALPLPHKQLATTLDKCLHFSAATLHMDVHFHDDQFFSFSAANGAVLYACEAPEMFRAEIEVDRNVNLRNVSLRDKALKLQENSMVSEYTTCMHYTRNYIKSKSPII